MKLSKLVLLVLLFSIGALFTFSCGFYAVKSKGNYSNMIKSYYKDNIKIGYSNVENNFDKKITNIEKYINCYENKIDEKDFDDEMKNKLNELYDYFNKNNYTLSFAYEDLETGLHISFNEKQKYFSASTIKAPVALYLYELAEQGKIDLNSYLTYTPNFYLEGSGSIQYRNFGEQYQLRDLVQRTLVESDNIAYQMIASVPNYNEIKNFWKEKGADNFWTSYVWGDNTAHDGIIYMKEIYNYSLKNTVLSNELVEYYNNSVQKLIKSNKGSKVIHKSGWHYEYMHDTGVVYDEHPYVVAIMSNKGNSDYIGFFNKASELIEQFHDLYWQRKSNICQIDA